MAADSRSLDEIQITGIYEGVPYIAPKYVTASFEPQEDITAYELARLLMYFHGKAMTEADWDSLGTMQRHFKRLA